MRQPNQSLGVARVANVTSKWRCAGLYATNLQLLVPDIGESDPVTIVLQAKQKKGEDVGDEDCSLVRKDGSVRFGKCKNVCKGKDVTKDSTGEYGGDYYCTEAARSGTVGLSVLEIFDRFILP